MGETATSVVIQQHDGQVDGVHFSARAVPKAAAQVGVGTGARPDGRLAQRAVQGHGPGAGFGQRAAMSLVRGRERQRLDTKPMGTVA